MASALAQAAKADTNPNVARLRPVDSIVVVVNDEVITRLELDAKVKLVETNMRTQKAAIPPRADLERQLLERMIVDRAQLQLAKELGIRIDDAMLDRATGRIAEQNKMTVQEFRNRLEKEGVAFPQFREEIRQEILLQRVREHEVDAKVQITDLEVDNFLAAPAISSEAQQEIRLAQILIRIPENASPELIAGRRARMIEVMQQVKSGGDFAKIAATYSDASDALTGGDIGWRTPDRLPQLFTDAVAKLKPGQVSDVLKSANGFHVLKLVDRRSAEPAKAAAAVEQTRARHILIKVNDAVTSNDARRKLVDIKERLDNKAATFEELAKRFSNDGSASKGGDLGWLYPGDTVPEFQRAMDALQPGQVSAPVESSFGFHLIEVLERKSDDVSKERQRLAARQALRERKIEEATDDWLRQLRDRAYVEFRSEEK
ncbi:MAG: peptidylprolyl isomerase [Pseudomonadota bacterium]